MKVLTHFLLWRFGLTRAETQTTDAERDCLAKYAVGRRCLVEIGVWHGVTTRRLRAAMAPDGVLYAVDPVPAGRLGLSLQRHIARREVSRMPRGRIVWIRLTGAEAGRAYVARSNPPVDFLFVDGDHSYDGIQADWLAWSDDIAPGGIVALHDSRSSHARPIEDAGSVRYTLDVILRDPRFRQIDAVDSLTVLERTPA